MEIDYKKQVDDYIALIPKNLEFEFLNMSARHYASIKEFVVDGKYKNLKIKVDGEMPQHLMFVTPPPKKSKFHR